MATQREQPKPKTVTTKRASKPRTKATPKAKTANSQADVAERYNVHPGSKVAQAAAMLEEGATMKAVKERTGQSCYNFLARMSARGHLVSRDEDGVITLRHTKDAS